MTKSGLITGQATSGWRSGALRAPRVHKQSTKYELL
jgi:hypothetical protein